MAPFHGISIEFCTTWQESDQFANKKTNPIDRSLHSGAPGCAKHMSVNCIGNKSATVACVSPLNVPSFLGARIAHGKTDLPKNPHSTMGPQKTPYWPIGLVVSVLV